MAKKYIDGIIHAYDRVIQLIDSLDDGSNIDLMLLKGTIEAANKAYKAIRNKSDDNSLDDPEDELDDETKRAC